MNKLLELTETQTEIMSCLTDLVDNKVVTIVEAIDMAYDYNIDTSLVNNYMEDIYQSEE